MKDLVVDYHLWLTVIQDIAVNELHSQKHMTESTGVAMDAEPANSANRWSVGTTNGLQAVTWQFFDRFDVSLLGQTRFTELTSMEQGHHSDRQKTQLSRKPGERFTALPLSDRPTSLKHLVD